MFSSARSMKSRTSSMRMSPRLFRSARAIRSSSGSSCSVRLTSSISFLPICTGLADDGAYDADRVLDDLGLGQAALLEPPQRQLVLQAGEGVRAQRTDRHLRLGQAHEAAPDLLAEA